jgi:hypothetical protein
MHCVDFAGNFINFAHVPLLLLLALTPKKLQLGEDSNIKFRDTYLRKC